MNFGLNDMNRNTPDSVYINRYTPAPLAPVKGGGGKRRPVKIINDNSLETIVFGMKNDSLGAV